MRILRLGGAGMVLLLDDRLPKSPEYTHLVR